MSFKYTALNNFENGSYSSLSPHTGSTDLTNKLFEMSQKGRNISNVKSFSKQSEFLMYSHRVEIDIKQASTKLSKLNELSNKSTLYLSEDAKIDELIMSVKESISDIQTKIGYLQTANDMRYSAQSEKLSKNILDILNMRFLSVTKDFKEALQKRTKKIKQHEEKKSTFTIAGNKVTDVRRRNVDKTQAAFLRNDRHFDLEGGSNGAGAQQAGLQQEEDISYLKKRSESIRNIEKMLGEIGGIFQRISSLVQMHETMIERIDKNTDDTYDNVKKGKKEIVKYYRYIQSNRRLIITVFVFLMIFAAIYIVFLA